MSTLTLEALDVRYGGVQAVRRLSFEVAPGEIVGLIGANGAGKSSTLHAIMGVAPIVGGDVRLGGETLRGRRRAQERVRALPDRRGVPRAKRRRAFRRPAAAAGDCTRARRRARCAPAR